MKEQKCYDCEKTKNKTTQRGKGGVEVLDVSLCCFEGFKVSSLRPGRTVHCIYGLFPPPNPGQTLSGQKPGQNPDQKSSTTSGQKLTVGSFLIVLVSNCPGDGCGGPGGGLRTGGSSGKPLLRPVFKKPAPAPRKPPQGPSQQTPGQLETRTIRSEPTVRCV